MIHTRIRCDCVCMLSNNKREIHWMNPSWELHSYDGMPAVVDITGTRAWYNDGSLHRINGPACHGIIFECWYYNSELHRDDDLPAFTDVYGNMQWTINGLPKCVDKGPFIINDDNTKTYILKNKDHIRSIRDKILPIEISPGAFLFANGSIYRGDGLCEHPDGTRIWRKDGMIHRDDDEPAARMADGSLIWMKNGILNRHNDRPAAIFADGLEIYAENGEMKVPSRRHKII